MNSTRTNRTLADLTVRELASLRLLNERLAQAERWVLERSLTRSMNSREKMAFAHETEELDQVQAQAKVSCLARGARPGWIANGDEIVAQLDCSVLFGRAEMTETLVIGQENEAPLNPLRDMLACRLFRDLRDLQLRGDLERMLAINTIRVEYSVLRRGSEEFGVSLKRTTA
jgi:hypothetical protein